MGGCMLCPRRCGADRENGRTGICGADSRIRIARAAPHYWEEPCISGTRGSGAVFFTGCPLGCVYCQNKAISSGGAGRVYSVGELARLFESLQAQGIHNINLVTPTHYTPQIVSALDEAHLRVPVVYNCSGYELPETLELLRGRVNIFLPDFKYADGTLAKRYSHAEDYPEVALAAIEKMLELVGEPKFDPDGMMTSGVIVRHMVLPNQTDNSMRALRMLRSCFGDSVLVSIMSQYTPMPNQPFEELARPVTDDEYELVLDYADHLGITSGFRQEGSAVGESFIPDFEV